jgi:AcrR family transcriptional regulator
MTVPSTHASGPARRLTRDQKKALTRQELLDAAGRVFLRRGFFAASIDEVAEEAGFSKGAVYSNFTDKEDLLLALVEQRTELRRSRITALVDPDASTETQARDASEEYNQILEEEREWNPLLLEFWVCVARNPHFNSGSPPSTER